MGRQQNNQKIKVKENVYNKIWRAGREIYLLFPLRKEGMQSGILLDR